MPRRPSPLPTTLAGRAFAVREAHAEGVTPRRLRASDLSRPFHAVRHPGEPTSLADRAAAYAARMPEHERFSHTTAAELHGMRMPTGHREGQLHVAALAPQRAPRTAGVAGHQRQDDETQLVTIGEASNVSGLRVSHPVRAWIECGALLSVRQLVVMGDGLVCRRGAVATPASLRRALRAVARHRGAARLTAALVDIRAGTDSAMETELRLVLQAADFPAPEVKGFFATSTARLSPMAISSTATEGSSSSTTVSITARSASTFVTSVGWMT